MADKDYTPSEMATEAAQAVYEQIFGETHHLIEANVARAARRIDRVYKTLLLTAQLGGGHEGCKKPAHGPYCLGCQSIRRATPREKQG